MVKEFLWETRDFECEELYALTTVKGFDNTITATKALKIMTLIPKLSQKYQLEMIRPNLDAIIQNNQTPFDNYTEKINSPQFKTLKQEKLQNLVELDCIKRLRIRGKVELINQPKVTEPEQFDKVKIGNTEIARRTSLIDRLVKESDV